MIPSSGCPPWPPDHPRTLPRTGIPTPRLGARPDPEHVQGDLRVLGIVLVPAVVERLARASERQGGDQPDREASLEKTPSEGTMVIAGGLESAGDRLAEAGQEVDKAVVVRPGVEHLQALPARVAGDL